ncbi:MAG: sugar ABC transporter permease [Phototrophicaceae bacterium]
MSVQTDTSKPKRKNDERLSDQALRRFFIWPALIYMVIVTQIPLLYTLNFSFQRWNMNRPDRRGYTGFDNYIDVITDNDFWTIILNTTVLTGAVVFITFVLGLTLALLLNRDFLGRGIVRTMLITPFLIMPTVSAVIWKNVLLDPSFGFITGIVKSFGFATPDFLGNYPMESVITIVVWQWMPFMMLILLAGLQSLSSEQIEAAQIDGANPLNILRHIVLPHLQRYIEIAVLMEILFILSVFGVIFITTSGGPGIQTTNLSYAIYNEAFSNRDIGDASTMGIYAIIVANIVVTFFVQVLRRGTEDIGESS